MPHGPLHPLPKFALYSLGAMDMYTFTHVSHTMALGQLKRDVATKVDANCVMNHTVASAIETTIAYLEKNNRKQQRTTHPII